MNLSKELRRLFFKERKKKERYKNKIANNLLFYGVQKKKEKMCESRNWTNENNFVASF